MYDIIIENFDSILIDINDLLYLSSDIIFDFKNQNKYELYLFYRYYRYNDKYCAYEIVFKNYNNHVFVFFPGSEINTDTNNRSINWRDKDHYLDCRNFIFRGLEIVSQEFIKSSKQIEFKEKLNICGFSLGAIPLYFYLYYLFMNIEKYINLKCITIELYSPCCLPEFIRKKIATLVNNKCQENKTIKLIIRYHIAENDIIPFLSNTFLFSRENKISSNISIYTYFYHNANNINKSNSYFYQGLLNTHNRFNHSAMNVKNINFGYFTKVTVLESLVEMYEFFSHEIIQSQYKNKICFYNFIIFLYKNYGIGIGTQNTYNFYYTLYMYYYMISELLFYYTNNLNCCNSNKIYILQKVVKFLDYCFYFNRLIYSININLLIFNLFLTIKIMLFIVNIVINLPIIIIVLLKDYLRQILEIKLLLNNIK